MAIITNQDFLNAKRDIEDIGKSTNTEAIINPRWGASFKSLPLVSKEWSQALASFNIAAAGLVNDWQNAINLITVKDGVPALAVFDANGENQQQINDKTIKFVGSVADLVAIENPKNGQVVFVKSYIEWIGVGYLGEATPYAGGGKFTYKASRSTENDGVFVFNGWERFLESGLYTPYMSGCVCDGVTDDTQSFDKLNFALQKNKLKGRIVIDKDILINSELPRTGSMTHIPTNVKCGVRLVTGVHIEILSGASIKIGNHFNDSETFVFCAANPSSLDDWEDEFPQDDVQLYGAGTIDSTQAGAMVSAHLNSRYLVFLSGCSNFKMHGLTTVGGDYGNIVVGRNRAKGVRFYNNHVKNTAVTTSKSHDHSSLWITAPDCKVYNNRFTDASPKAQIMNCAFESHGNEHYFYNNYVDNFLVSVLQCAYAWDIGNQRTKDNMYVYGNTSNSWFFMSLWFQENHVRPYGFGDTYDNTHNSIPYISKAQLMAQGVQSDIIDVRDLTRRAFVSTAQAIAKDYYVLVEKSLQFRENSFYASFSPSLEEQFFDMRIVFNEGMHFYDNFMKTPKLFTIKNQFEYLGLDIPYILNNFIWKDNTVDYSGVPSGKVTSELNVHRLNNCHFDVNINASYPLTIAQNITNSCTVVDVDNSKNNTLQYTHNGQSNLALACAGIYPAMLNNPFALNNKVVVDDKPTVYVEPNSADTTKAKVFTLEPAKTFKNGEVISYSSSAYNGFVLPSRLFQPIPTSDLSLVGVALDFSMSNSGTATLNSRPHIRLSN